MPRSRSKWNYCLMLCLLLTAPSGNTADQWQDARANPMNIPPFEGSVQDPDTGYKVWRLGGNAAEMQAALPHPKGKDVIGILHAQHFYSRTPPLNADGTHILGSKGQQESHAALWRLRDKKLVAWVPAAREETNIQQRQLLWDPQQANVYWFTEGNCLVQVTINFTDYTLKRRTWDCFRDFTYVTFGQGEGNFSDDGKRLVIAGEDRTNGYIYLLPYEVKQHRRHPPRQTTSAQQPEMNWAGVDPSGRYIVFDREKPRLQTLVIPFDGAATATPRVLYNHLKHSDFVLDAKGDAWIMYGNWQGVFGRRLRDSQERKIWPPPGDERFTEENVTASGHVGRVAGKPGVVLISRNIDGGLYLLDMEHPDKMHYVGNSRHGRFTSKSETEQTIKRWGADRHGTVTFYKREARAAASPAGNYIFFVSDYHAHVKDKGGYDPEPVCTAYLNMIEVKD